MRKEEYQQEERPRKKKKTHRLYALIVIILGIAIIVLGVLILFYTQKIEISGNEYCTDQEIVDTVKNDRYSMNTLYILGKYKLGYGDTLPCFESMKVGLKLPWVLKVEVKEKPIVGYVQNGEGYAYFDKEGMVVAESSSLISDLPCIEGVEMKDIQLYQQLKSEDARIFEEILETSKDVTKYKLSTDKIVCKDDKIYLYIGNVCVSLGNHVSAEQIAQIKPIIEKLGEQSGTLHLENYSETSKTITFDIGEFPE